MAASSSREALIRKGEKRRKTVIYMFNNKKQ